MLPEEQDKQKDDEPADMPNEAVQHASEPAEPSLQEAEPAETSEQEAENELDELDVRRLFQSMRSLNWKPPTPETALTALLQRMEGMRPLLKDFCRSVQLRETAGLSKATVMGTCSSKENGWNELQHELALGRQASAPEGGQRLSRMQNWMAMQQNVHKGMSAADSASSPLHMTTHFGSSSADGAQVLLFLKADGTVAEAFTLSVYRGAVLTGNASRRLKVSRPSAIPLPPSLCKIIRVVELVQGSANTWVASSLNPTHLLEPNQVLGEWTPESVQKMPQKTYFKFSPEVRPEI